MKSKECLNENKKPKIPLVVICSPTATGKTSLSVDLAAACRGEIINADSLQVYRYLNIGSAKPSLEERKNVTHHLIDIVNPDEEYNAALYAKQARAIIEEFARQKIFFVVGGTGLYIRALLFGMLDAPPVDKQIRQYYQNIREKEGRAALYELLRKKDPGAARLIHPCDAVRVMRALEVWEQSGVSIIALRQKHSFADSPYEVCKIGLHVEKEDLKNRIRQRVVKMVENGFVEEVQGLLDRGYSETLKPLRSLGYRQIIDFLRGRCDWQSAIDSINRETWHYSKRQATWFSADKTINWFSPGQEEEIRQRVEQFQPGFPPSHNDEGEETARIS